MASFDYGRPGSRGNILSLLMHGQALLVSDGIKRQTQPLEIAIHESFIQITFKAGI